jgi:hypothetical protein
MLTMRPQRRERMAGSTAWVHRNADLRLTAMVRSNSASVRSSSSRRRAMPALLMSTSGWPSSRAMLSSMPLTAAPSETSARTVNARRPRLRIASATASASAVRAA